MSFFLSLALGTVHPLGLTWKPLVAVLQSNSTSPWSAQNDNAPRSPPTKGFQLRGLAAELAHRVTGVASLAINTEGGPMERFTVPLHCKSPRISESDATEQHIKIRSLITNGNQTKYVFDCKRV